MIIYLSKHQYLTIFFVDVNYEFCHICSHSLDPFVLRKTYEI